MAGMAKFNGRKISGFDHLMQSIIDILSTPVGSRVMRRDYGSDLFRLVDEPANPQTIISIYAAVADALNKWEPRYQLQKIAIVESTTDGQIIFDLQGILLIEGKIITFEGLEVAA